MIMRSLLQRLCILNLRNQPLIDNCLHRAPHLCQLCFSCLLVIGVFGGTFNSKVSKVTFIILSPSTIEASHSWLMRHFELYAIITQPIALVSVAACQASGRLCLFT